MNAASDVPSRRVYVRGVHGTPVGLGSRVVELLSALPGYDVVLDGDGSDGDGRDGDGRDGVEACDAIVDVGIGDYDLLGQRGESATVGATELLADADALGADHLVVLSSAMVYGAVANNPVPLTEESVLRPDPSFVYARQLAAAEELVESWRVAEPGRRVAVLRPAIPIAADGTSSLARALTSGFGQRFGESDPMAQFVHHDDVASAVALAVGRQLDGVYNVAPDGAVPGDRVRALSGRRLRLPLPERLSEVLGALRWRFQRGPIPPGLRAYTRHTWTVANDKLRAEGWAPTVTNEQAYVEGTEANWWTMVTPKRRQEIALGGMIAAIALGAGGAFLAVRAWIRRRAARAQRG